MADEDSHYIEAGRPITPAAMQPFIHVGPASSNGTPPAVIQVVSQQASQPAPTAQTQPTPASSSNE